MKTRHIIILVLMAFFLGFILYPVVRPEKPAIVNTDTIYVQSVSFDTIIQEKPVPVEVLKYVPKYTTIYKPIQIPVDTAQIIAEYFSVKSYDDVLKDDSAGYVRLKEKVYQSSIIDRELFFEARCTDRIVTNTINPSGLYVLGGIGGSRESISMSMGVLYQNKSARLYGARIGYFQKPYIELNYGFKF